MIATFALLILLPHAVVYSFLLSNKHPAQSTITSQLTRTLPIASTQIQARPRSKWDLLEDEDEDDSTSASVSANVPPDMLYVDANIRRQMNNYDQLVAVGGKDVVNDVYVRAPGEKEWWLVGKVARVSDVSPEQAIERQWPLIERHVWSLRLPVRPTSNLSEPFEVWYAPGDTEYDAARNDPSVKFTKCSSVLAYNDKLLNSALVGFVGKVYTGGEDDPLFFVERNVEDGSVLVDMELEGDWMLRSEIKDRKKNVQVVIDADYEKN